MGNMKLVGLPRYSLSSLASGSTVAATMPLTNLTTGEPWDVARLTEVDPVKTYVEGVPAMPNGYYGPDPSVGGVAWVNHNLSLGATARTVLLTSGAVGYVPTRIAPNAVIKGGIWSASGSDHTAIDEDPYAFPNDGEIDANSVGSGTLRIQFPTPASAPATGVDRQLFRVVVGYSQIPDSVTFRLLENGTERALLSSTIEGADPRLPSLPTSVVLLPWDASDLLTADGSLVELSVELTLDTGDDFAIYAADWLCDTNVTGGSVLADTGWTSVTMDQYDAAWGATVSGTVGAAPQQTFLNTFSDSNVLSVAKIVTYFRDPLNTAGYIDLGEFVAGPIFVPGLNVDWGEVVSLRGRDKIINGEGGSRWGIRREPTRSVKINLSNLTASEAQSVLERFWRAGQLLPYVIQVLDDSTESRHTTLYVCTDSLPRMSANYVDYRSVSFDATEKL